MIILNDASYHAFEKYLIDDSHHGIAWRSYVEHLLQPAD